MSVSQQTCRARLRLADEAGLHLRPAAQLVTVANQFDSDIVVEHEGKKANGKSLLSVVTLCAEMGARLTVLARGQDAPQAVKAIRNLFKRLFGDAQSVAVGANAGMGTIDDDSSEIRIPVVALASVAQARLSPPGCVEVQDAASLAGVAASEQATSRREDTSMLKSKLIRQTRKTHTFMFDPTTPATDVSVAGEFSDWDLLPMARRTGVFQASVKVAPGTYQYKFVVDGNWIDDLACGERVPNGLGGTNCVLRIAE